MVKSGTGNYESDKEKLLEFLQTFHTIRDDGSKLYKYSNSLTRIAHREQTALRIDLDDIHEFDPDLAEVVINNTLRYTKIVGEVVQSILPNYIEREVVSKDALDVFIQHRLLTEERNRQNDDSNNIRPKYPPELLRRFEVYFNDLSTNKVVPIREMNACRIGKLSSVKGVVMRSTDVKPMMSVATYCCDMCGAETYHCVNGLHFKPLAMCPSPDCQSNKAGGRLHLQTRGSKFYKFQELKIQELSDQVPVGSIPCSLTVVCKGENTRLAMPGDHVNVTGIFLTVVKSGFNPMTSNLLSETFLEAHTIQILNKSDKDDLNEDLTEEEIDKISDPNFYAKLAASIAPEIYGHQDIKKALLLLLVGGVDKNPDGMKIRGNINICLMGDPGVAKSQLLSFIERLAARSQYTTGRGSSGAGLTAAVMRDPLTNEMILEGGALVLADGGVCCIDEFDKMSDYDRTAIHEVMEQQKISIAKAGIMTRLNARVSILAAANPVYGRYDPKKSIEQNVQLPPALLSRFDLLWLIQDKANLDVDLELAKHITYVHTHCKQPPVTDFQPLEMSLIRKYILLCQKKCPVVPEELTEFIVRCYVELRNEARNSMEASFTSARNLLAILRISSALAKLRLSDVVEKDDIKEALRLLEMSKISLKSTDQSHRKDAMSDTDKIYDIIKNMKSRDSNSVEMTKVFERCAQQGFNKDQVMVCVNKYDELDILELNQTRTRLTFREIS